MPEKIDLQDEIFIHFLQDQYGLQAPEVTFLRQGGDINAAAYRVITKDNRTYFLKLLRGVFDETSVRVSRFLYDQGICQINAPITTVDNRLWTQLEGFHAVLYPFIEGQNAFEVALTAPQWVNFGAALRAIHAAKLPAELDGLVRREVYSPHWQERVGTLLEYAQKDTFADPIAARYARILAAKSGEILHFVQVAELLGAALKTQERKYVLCHSDIHAGNLRASPDGNLFIIDWDHPVLAPKERDLMFIGGGVGSAWNRPHEEEYFYAGYGRTEIDPVALAYYRFERIVQDIAEWGELTLFTDKGGKDRARALQGLIRWFSPNDVVAMAYKAEHDLPTSAALHRPRE